jgi:hypothetical protein
MFQFLGIIKLTLPENQGSPTEELQRANVFPVSLDIARKFRHPIGFPASRHPALATPLMLVPKAAVHKDDFLPAVKHEIRLPRKVFRVQSIPVPQRMNQPAHQHLRPRVLAANTAHIAGTALWSQLVHGSTPIIWNRISHFGTIIDIAQHDSIPHTGCYGHILTKA